MLYIDDTDLPATTHVQPTSIGAWLYHRGFATLAERTDAVQHATNGTLEFAYSSTEYRVSYHHVGEYGQYHVEYVRSLH